MATLTAYPKLFCMVGLVRCDLTLILDILAHEFSENLGGRPILRSANFNEPLAQRMFDPYSKACVLCHSHGVANGYTASTCHRDLRYVSGPRWRLLAALRVKNPLPLPLGRERNRITPKSCIEAIHRREQCGRPRVCYRE